MRRAAGRREIVAVYGGGLLQGLALVTFPAASAVLTGGAYGLTERAYGLMFAPQVALAIVAALLGGRVQRRWGEKRAFLAGLGANLASMALLLGSRFVTGAHGLTYALLLAATACMGTGFGLTVPVVNTLAASLFPDKVDVAILALNALLGLGTALAPVLIALYGALGAWWGLPLTIALLLASLLAWSAPLPLDAAGAPESKAVRSRRFWLFLAFAFGYGIVETLNGNWAILYMKGVLHAAGSLAALALTAFWAAATAGRVLCAGIERQLPPRTTFRLLPWAVAIAFLVTSLAPTSPPGLGVACFGLAGLGCSALLPLTISLGSSDAAPGYLIAFYQMGYGVAAFGIDPLRHFTGLGMRALFGGGSGIAIALGALAVMIVGAKGRSRRAPGSKRPRALSVTT